jgi:hypothetical protein
VCTQAEVTLYFLAFSFPEVWCCLPFHGQVWFHFLCAESLEASVVVVALWLHIVLVSAYHGRLIAPSILNDSFAC